MISAVTRLRDRAHAFSKSRFVRNVAAVATGIAAAQAISLAFMPFLTRLYRPESFGALAAFTAVVNIITPLATLGYANAIVMPETEEGATAVARLSLVCAALVAPLALVFVFLFQSRLAAWTGLEATPGFLYLIPVSLLLGALLSVANYTAIREGLFKAKAGSHVASTLAMNIGKLAGGVLAPTGMVLIVISMVGKALNYSMLLARVPRRGAFEVRRWFGTTGVREAAREQRDFALYRMPQSILNAATLGLPVVMLSSLFGVASAGQYGLAMVVLAAPVTLLGQAVGEVFLPRVTRAILACSPDANALLVKATLGLSAVAIPAFALVTLWGDWLFVLVFGSEWTPAGEYAQWLSVWLAATLASRASLSAFPALGLQGFLLVREIASVILRVAALYVGFAYFDSDIAAIALFSLVGVLVNASLIVAAHRRLTIRSREWLHASQGELDSASAESAGEKQ